ncbi:hypothetical protein M514_08825 [Trichuris suis]|uniref:Uncharacterized protein n=1 Tax=Trichuris suis TaxID=68888 RepID=A0A085NJ67_9BILA|nr:hypothetical protein M513_08825 [Trichuris suis]KFD69513.1 hypothetical protein M514_08825 [Trichuris suis]
MLVATAFGNIFRFSDDFKPLGTQNIWTALTRITKPKNDYRERELALEPEDVPSHLNLLRSRPKR